jgi:hypothetical protein
MIGPQSTLNAEFGLGRDFSRILRLLFACEQNR